MKKIALFAVAALIGTASFAAPKVIKHAVKKAPAKTENVFTVKAPRVAADSTGKKVSKVQKTHKKTTTTTTTPKAK
ncbi:hypothetical protein [Chitinophaga costaii]|nr:hypothetical protein [Chitinophaga costaii]